MLTKSFVINCSIGLHARPASVLVDKAGQFKSDITMKYKDKSVPVKSIIGVMALGVVTGQTVEVTVSGQDQEEAMKVMEDFFEKEILDL